MKKIPLIVVGGPTASGKTRLAIDIAKAVGGEIVNADSVQIYKELDIGSAKPTAEERAEVKHHLVDFLDVFADFSVADYTELAHKTIADIDARGKIAVLTGGTGLYINSVVDDISFGEIDTNYEIRAELQKIADEQGGEALIEMLRRFDPLAASRMHPNNVRRIIRAIEFYRVTGTPISEHQEMTRQAESRYDPVMFCIEWDREELYGRINRRVDIMMEEGLLDEVRRLMDMGCTKDLNSMKGIGYKELMDNVNGECTLGEAVETIKRESRRYAKRQLTWFRRDKRIHWLDARGDVFGEAVKILNEYFAENGLAVRNFLKISLDKHFMT